MHHSTFVTGSQPRCTQILFVWTLTRLLKDRVHSWQPSLQPTTYPSGHHVSPRILFKRYVLQSHLTCSLYKPNALDASELSVFQESPEDSQLVKCTICAAFESNNERAQQQHPSHSWVPRNETASHLTSPTHRRCVAAHQWSIARTRRTRQATHHAHDDWHDNHNCEPQVALSERVNDDYMVPALVKFAISRSRTHRRDDLLEAYGHDNSLRL